MVISNLKVRLESLSTTTRQVITHTDSFRGLLACPFYCIRTHRGMPHIGNAHRPLTQLHAKFIAVGVHCIRATRYCLPVFTLAKGCVCSVRCHAAIFLLFLPEQH